MLQGTRRSLLTRPTNKSEGLVKGVGGIRVEQGRRRVLGRGGAEGRGRGSREAQVLAVSQHHKGL